MPSVSPAIRSLLRGRPVRQVAALSVAAALLLAAAGCVKVEDPDSKRAPAIVKTAGFANEKKGQGNRATGLPGEDPKPGQEIIELPDIPSPPNALDTLAPQDAKLGDIGGLLLMYYGMKQKLPNKLEDLAPLADADRPLDLRCPESGQPYVYVRQTLNSSISGQKLVAYAPTVSKDGRYATLMMSLVSTAHGTTPTAGVARLSEDELRQKLPRSATPAGPGAAAVEPVGAGAAAR